MLLPLAPDIMSGNSCGNVAWEADATAAYAPRLCMMHCITLGIIAAVGAWNNACAYLHSSSGPIAVQRQSVLQRHHMSNSRRSTELMSRSRRGGSEQVSQAGLGW
mgnify:CR=1 FL=1